MNDSTKREDVAFVELDDLSIVSVSGGIREAIMPIWPMPWDLIPIPRLPVNRIPRRIVKLPTWPTIAA
ncbi:MAG: hypothetical protein ACK5M4_15035 [Pseudorhodobacter sp.]